LVALTVGTHEMRGVSDVKIEEAQCVLPMLSVSKAG
jgi:hypothetical protein